MKKKTQKRIRRINRNNKKTIFLCFLLVAVCLGLLFLFPNLKQYLDEELPSIPTPDLTVVTPTENPESTPDSTPSGENQEISDGRILTVTFLDVGNADCNIIQLPTDEVIVIDAGENSDGKKVVEYIKSLGIERIDYIIGTHPHSDHIGGLDTVIDSFDIGKVYLPRIPDEYAPSTKTYLSVLESVSNKGLKITSPSAGDILYEDDSLKVWFLNEADGTLAKDNMNRYSLVLKVQYRNKSFLFTGDAEKKNEARILETISLEDIDSDVLKLGHHGSDTSSSEEWINAVSPDIIFIPCGEGNDYGHPHEKTMNIINKTNAEIYRTDKNGTVIMTTDGNNITVTTER